MKSKIKWMGIMLLMFVMNHIQAQTALPPVPKARITFDETSFDFGEIPQWTPVTHTFTFKNTGSKPLYIYNVNRKCGCTTPEWSHGMIPPGGTGFVKITFNAVETGYFNKEMTVANNGVTEYIEIDIVGVVKPMPMPDSIQKKSEE